jgi:hypothetical protein
MSIPCFSIFKGSDVKWYKGTSEWQIKPSKFFKPKSDGTKHQLFILEAYAEDEGKISLFILFIQYTFVYIQDFTNVLFLIQLEQQLLLRH